MILAMENRILSGASELACPHRSARPRVADGVAAAGLAEATRRD
jgi:hypothetical protein